MQEKYRQTLEILIEKISNINSDTDDSELHNIKMHRLFKLVFRNIVLFRKVNEFISLYNKNKCVEFNNRRELLDYKEREYIHKVIYKGDGKTKGDGILIKGDLPIGCVLKEVVFTKSLLSSIESDAIPHGVEILEFCIQNRGNSYETPFLSLLPSTIHTVKNASISFSRKVENYIPPNITSLSFSDCPYLLTAGSIVCSNGISMSHTIESLKFSRVWNNGSIPLKVGDFPNGLIKLSIVGITINNISKGVLPNTIKELALSYNKNIGDDSTDLFDILPTTLESLYLFCRCDITASSNLNNFTFLRKLMINYNCNLVSNSLPPNITELHLMEIKTPIKDIVIPNRVTNLKLQFKNIEFSLVLVIPNSTISLSFNVLAIKECVFPDSITDITLFCDDFHYYRVEGLKKMLKLLPKSVTSITIANTFNPLTNFLPKAIKFPSTIKTIIYKDISPTSSI